MIGSASTVKLIKNISEKLDKKSNNLLREYDITISQVRVLYDLMQVSNHSLTFKEVEKLSGVSQSACVGIVSRLEEKKLVRSHVDRSDRRVKIVRITKAGEELLQIASSKLEPTEEQIHKGFTAEEKNELFYLLLRLSDNLE